MNTDRNCIGNYLGPYSGTGESNAGQPERYSEAARIHKPGPQQMQTPAHPLQGLGFRALYHGAYALRSCNDPEPSSLHLF